MEDGTSRSPRHTKGTRCPPTRVELTQTCEIRDLLDRLADKWSLLVVELLGEGTQRFSELRREIDGISQRMLTLTLRRLERDGLVHRTVHPVVPPRVDYDLSRWARRSSAPSRRSWHGRASTARTLPVPAPTTTTK